MTPARFPRTPAPNSSATPSSPTPRTKPTRPWTLPTSHRRLRLLSFAQSMSGSSGNRKKRIRTWTPEERAAHRVFEKSRRDAFNDSMIELAKQVPSLVGTRRLNKHMIVEHSIARHQAQRQLCLSAAQSVQALLAERDELLAEVNQWRSAAGVALPPREEGPAGQQLQELVMIEHETFGTFPNGFGDNAPEDGSGDDQHQEETEYAHNESTAPNVLSMVDAEGTVNTLRAFSTLRFPPTAS
ncbi:hypothetical protein K458DRAFT_393948 [Lentithecium fluviatile CBS 122367]|uniref:BHLH domain-containing protein n=1 Tax=Lentithecium fluviatile CBS 122367 TaxID=1168545 RepID=A0A6G1IMQ7_9PLEO|nr:hypothetical protein K458DRAFT_393948 [Lentithecium fluviatile CBS 122367]